MLDEGRMPDGSRVSVGDVIQRIQQGPGSGPNAQRRYEEFHSQAKAALAEANDCTEAEVEDVLTRRLMDVRRGAY